MSAPPSIVADPPPPGGGKRGDSGKGAAQRARSGWESLRQIWQRRFAPKSPLAPGGSSMLPVLIEVFAGFSMLDGSIEEEEIDSALGYLRYDYPEGIYSDLRRMYFEALQKPQDLVQQARDLSRTLTMEQKILLGVQLYLLISRSPSSQRQMVEIVPPTRRKTSVARAASRWSRCASPPRRLATCCCARSRRIARSIASASKGWCC